MTEHTVSASQSTGGESTATKSVRPWKVIAAASIGNALEWYDISIYAYFSVYISVAFFPAESHSVSIMLALGTFALSFFIRPVGAIVLGSFADRKGRKPALTLTIWLMFLGTLMIVVMPPAHVIGLAAPLLILLARLIQGFAAGGEFGSATSLMVEHLPNRKGFAASWQFTSQAMSTILASVIGVVLTTGLSQEQLETWGFRLPFIVGLLVGPVGLYIRRHVPESPEFTAAAGEVPKESAGIRGVLRHHKLAVILAIGAIAVSTSLNYFITYVPTYAVDNLGMTSSAGFWATLVSGIILLLCTPVAGYFCDKVGRLTFMIPAAVAVMVLTWVLFTWVVAANALSVLIVVVAIFSLFKAADYGPLASVMGDIFPTEVRGTGLSLGYNVGVAIFGGLTPLVAAWLIGVTGDAKAPAYWVLLAGALSVTAILVVWKKLGVR